MVDLPIDGDPLDGDDDAARSGHHLVISGTGRAGTSFLVRFLGACGLDIGPDREYINDLVRAGLERRLLDDTVPYVVKDPWLSVYLEQIDLSRVAIDALVVPVRNLMAAATSRIVQERMARADTHWRDWPASDIHATVNGGALYSIDAVDEARLLAVGFYRLIHWSTTNSIPLVLLDFPRAAQDPRYLVESLRPWLPDTCSDEDAKRAFASVADGNAIRAETWTEPAGDPEPGLRNGDGEWSRLDREAFAELLRARTEELAMTTDKLAHFAEQFSRSQDQLALTQSQSDQRVEQSKAELAAVEAKCERTEADLSGRLGAALERIEGLTSEIDALRRTLSWRVTRPLRWVRGHSRGRSA